MIIILLHVSSIALNVIVVLNKFTIHRTKEPAQTPQKQTPNVGIEPTTTRLRVVRSTD